MKLLESCFRAKLRGGGSLDGPVLELNIGPGKRSTAAIYSWKAVAFDLSALTLACDGAAATPAWLLHDSPREADLGESIYEKPLALRLSSRRWPISSISGRLRPVPRRACATPPTFAQPSSPDRQRSRRGE